MIEVVNENYSGSCLSARGARRFQSENGQHKWTSERTKDTSTILDSD